jgi:hypothetical protein
MRTLTDIKRRLAPGVVLECIGQTRRPELVGTRRTVVKVQGNGYCFNLDTGAESWMFWPKAAHVRVLDADTFEVDLASGGRVHGVVTLRFVPAGG